MELQDYIDIEFSILKMEMGRVLDTLTQPEVNWRPASGCNSIGIILLHIARTEDRIMQTISQEKSQIWETEKWYEKLKLPVEEDMGHFTAEQVDAFKVPDTGNIMAYYDAVRIKAKEYLKGMAIADFDKKVTFPFGELTKGAGLAFLVSHAAQHIGEISYLRGLQRGLDK